MPTGEHLRTGGIEINLLRCSDLLSCREPLLGLIGRGRQHVVRDHTAGSPGSCGGEPTGYWHDNERPERGRGCSNTGVVPAAADEVSALTAAQFAAHAQMYQTVSAQAAAIHEMFVNTLVASSGSYAATEAANAAAAG